MSRLKDNLEHAERAVAASPVWMHYSALPAGTTPNLGDHVATPRTEALSDVERVVGLFETDDGRVQVTSVSKRGRMTFDLKQVTVLRR